MFERILIPLDGSPVAETAVPFAATLPSREVLLLHVDAERDRLFSDIAPAGRVLAVRSYLDAIARGFNQLGRRVEVAVECGEPAERIVDAATSADLIVMATDGRGMGGRLVGGCTGDRVARHAPAPTLMIRGNEHHLGDNGFARVVVALDGSTAAEAALAPASRLASALTVPLRLLRVEELVTNVASAADVYLREVSGRVEPGLQISADVLQGDPSEVILRAIQPDDLLVLTTHGGGGMRRWFLGKVTERLLRRAVAPVLIAREVLPETIPLPMTDASAQVWW